MLDTFSAFSASGHPPPLVSMANGIPALSRRSRVAFAPGSASEPRSSTPSMSNNIAGVVEACVANKRAGAAEVCGTRAREAALLNCVHKRRACCSGCHTHRGRRQSALVGLLSTSNKTRTCQRIAALVAMVHNDFWRLELKPAQRCSAVTVQWLHMMIDENQIVMIRRNPCAAAVSQLTQTTKRPAL